MDNTSKQAVGAGTKLEDKKEIISSKIWALETPKKEIALNVNGSIPNDIGNSMLPNQVYPTNYVFDDGGVTKRKLLYKTNDKVYSLNIIEE